MIFKNITVCYVQHISVCIFRATNEHWGSCYLLSSFVFVGWDESQFFIFLSFPLYIPSNNPQICFMVMKKMATHKIWNSDRKTKACSKQSKNRFYEVINRSNVRTVYVMFNTREYWSYVNFDIKVFNTRQH